MNNNNITKEEKLRLVGINENDFQFFSDKAANIVYNNFKQQCTIKNINESRLLFLLNEILKKCGYEYIDKINKFKVYRDDITKLDGESFVEEYKETFKNNGINIHKHLSFNTRNSKKSYILTALKGFARFYGYTISPKIKTKVINGHKDSKRFYVLIKS